MQMQRTLSLALVLSLAAACGEHKVSNVERSTVPEHFYLAQAPAGAIDVTSAHAGTKDGDPIVLRGAIGGSEEPFVEGLSAFTIVDLSLENTCLTNAEDHCETPWDYCCVDPASLAKGSATVELVEDGELLKTTARQFHGLDHLAKVVVQGTAKRDAQGNLTVLATGVHRLP
jgi:hypothetical protein